MPALLNAVLALAVTAHAAVAQGAPTIDQHLSALVERWRPLGSAVLAPAPAHGVLPVPNLPDDGFRWDVVVVAMYKQEFKCVPNPVPGCR